MAKMAHTFTRGSPSSNKTNEVVDDVFQALSDKERRRVLYYLVEETNGRVEIGDLVELLQTTTGKQETEKGHRHARITLRHNHIPQMETMGIVSFDEQSDIVEYQGGGLLEDCLALAITNE